ncbi:fatty acid desaturase [Gordonia pseudamarae]|uniref:acyl-ACP desaturase n=1 Tax=Gordonia TaxID=2053 RepID=UPI0019AB154D|nr:MULTISPECIES: acyl-ACP desaturase [Gordonia]MBD0020471.1 acyl-ACP desaturase [Gordonia sp. (in: high G+C Gram-positive bacteria)]QHN25681.1 fatty acid desaturase [Gordonia pseudamarae]
MNAQPRTNALSDDDLILALEKALPEIAEDHRAAAQPWNPHDWVPWDAGRNFAFLGGSDWEPGQATLTDEVRAGVLALLLLKDNLPSYHRMLAVHFPVFSAWRELVGVWTAEDNRHAIVLRDYLVVTRAVDPVDAEVRRRIHVTAGFRQYEGSATDVGPLDVLAIMAVHEHQCAAFVRRLGEAVSDSIDEAVSEGVLAQILRRIAADDALQARTFAAFLGAGIVADQEAAIVAIDRALSGMEAIGADVADFDAERALIADYENDGTRGAVAAALVDALTLESVQELSDDAEAARGRILALAALADRAAGRPS